MAPNQPKQPLASWFLLGAMVLVVGSLLTIWVIRYDENLAADWASGTPTNLPVDDLKSSFGYLGEALDEKTKQFTNLFTAKVEGAATESNEQNEGQVGQLTNAGLTNQQIESIEQDLFENVAPQE